MSDAHVEGPGLRTGAGGQVLSSGCNDLDQLCGGGLALGSLVIIIEVISYTTLRLRNER